MTLDMTRGKPVKCLLLFAFPLMLSSLLQQLYTLCDSVIVGRLLGTLAFTATGSASYLNWFPLSMLMGAIQGFGVPLAQKFGAKNKEEFRRFFASGIVLSLLIGILISGFGLFFVRPFLVKLNTPAELMDYAERYIRVLWMGFWATAILNIFTTALMAMGDSRTPLTALAVSSVVNIALDLVLIAWFDMSVEGAALATILAQLCAAAWSFRGLVRAGDLLPKRCHFQFHGYVMKELLRMGFPRLMSNGVISSGELLVQSAINACGVVFVTGMTAARRYFNLTNVIGYGLEGALATFVGQNYGAGNKSRIIQGTRSAAAMGLFSSVVTGIGVWLLAEPMIRFFVPDGSAEVLSVGVNALRIQAVFLWGLYLLCEHRAAIQGMGNAMIPMFSGFLELALRIGSALLLPIAFGQEGLYFTDVVAWVPTMLMLTVSYHILKNRLLKA